MVQVNNCRSDVSPGNISDSDSRARVGYYSQSFVYCRVFVLLIIDCSTKKGVLVYSRKCASEIVYFRSNPYRKQCELMC